VDKNRISGDYMTLFIRKTGDEKFEQFIPEGQTLSHHPVIAKLTP